MSGLAYVLGRVVYNDVVLAKVIPVVVRKLSLIYTFTRICSTVS